MKIREAIEKGIRRVKPLFSLFEDCYIILPKKNGRGLESFAFLFSRTEQELIKVQTPQEIFLPTQDNFFDQECEEYKGVLDKEDN